MRRIFENVKRDVPNFHRRTSGGLSHRDAISSRKFVFHLLNQQNLFHRALINSHRQYLYYMHKLLSLAYCCGLRTITATSSARSSMRKLYTVQNFADQYLFTLRPTYSWAYPFLSWVSRRVKSNGALSLISTTIYSHAPHNDVPVNDGPHIRRWSHNFIILYYHNITI